MWTFPGLAFLHSLCGHTNWVRSVAWAPHSALVVSCSDDYTVRVWRAPALHQYPEFQF